MERRPGGQPGCVLHRWADVRGDVHVDQVLAEPVDGVGCAPAWLDPPAEHGVLKLLAFLAQKVARNITWRRLPPRHELAEADGLGVFFRVVDAYRSRKTLGLAEQPELAGLQVVEGVVHVPIGHRPEVRAIYRVPTVNLETASAETRRGARAKWGAVLNGLPHPIQVVIRGRHAATLPVVERIETHGSVPARELAAWLGAHRVGSQLVERERYLVVPARDMETLSDRCASLEASLRRIGLHWSGSRLQTSWRRC